MAFKKTSGLSTRVGPSGLPDLGGYRAAASQFNSVAESLMGLGTDMRKANLNEAILKAEAAGQTAGATYDKDNNLVPLTSLDLDKAIEDSVFGESEKSALRQAYKNSAIKTYAATVNLDAKQAAQRALDLSPNDPSQIRGALDGYIEGLGLEEEVLQYVMPNIVAQFTAKESQANAQFQLEQRATKERVNLDNIDDVSDRLATLMAKGPGTNPGVAAGQKKMIDELNEDLQGSFDALETLGYQPDQIETLKDAIASKIAIRTSKAHISRVYQNGKLEGKGASSALLEIQSVKQEFADDDSIDQEAVAESMKSHLAELIAIDTATERERTISENNVAGDASLSIALGEFASEDQILNLATSPEQKRILLTQFRSRVDGIERARTAVVKANEEMIKTEFDRQMLKINNPSLYTPDEIFSSQVAINTLYEQGLLPPDLYGKYQTKIVSNIDEEMKAYDKIVKGDSKQKGDAAIAFIKEKLGPSGGYIVTKDWLNKTKEDLISRGIVGTGEFAVMTQTQWQTMANSYLDKQEKLSKKAKDLGRARAAALNGTATESQVNLLRENLSTRFESHPEGGIWNHPDPEVRENNYDLATKFFLRYNIMPEELVSGLANLRDAAVMSDEAFDAKRVIFNKFFKSIKMGASRGGTTDLAMPELIARNMMNKNGIDVTNYEMASFLGRKSYIDLMTAADNVSENAARALRNLDNQYPDIRSAIRENFNGAVRGQGFLEAFVNNFVPFWDTPNAKEKNIIGRIRSSGPQGIAGDIDDAYIGDERLMRLVELKVLKQFATKRVPITDDGLKQAIMNAVTELSDDGKGNALVGISVDSNDEPYWTVYPWYDNAKRSFGSALTSDTDVSESVFRDVRMKAMSPDVMLGKRQRDLLEGNGQIILTANSYVGGEQNYRVSVVDPETSQAYTVLSDYKFDYKTSVDSAAYTLAVSSMKNDKVRSFLANIPMMKPVIFSGVLQNMNEKFDDFRDPGVVTDVINFIGKSNPFIQFESIDLYSASDRADIEVLYRFMNGELLTEQDVLDARRKYDE